MTERMVSLSDVHTHSLQMPTDITGGTESATGLHGGLTKLSPITLSIESAAAVTNTLSPGIPEFIPTQIRLLRQQTPQVQTQLQHIQQGLHLTPCMCAFVYRSSSRERSHANGW
ncbi:hypothetical protein XENOCAPTIV_005326, partial [Xenoophorus captivus]